MCFLLNRDLTMKDEVVLIYVRSSKAISLTVSPFANVPLAEAGKTLNLKWLKLIVPLIGERCVHR